MSAPITKTTVNEPNATSAARRLFDELAAAEEADGDGATPEIDGGSTGKPVDAADPAGGAAGVVGMLPAAGRIGGGDGRERLWFAAGRGMPDAALRSMMTVPWSAMSWSSSSEFVMERAMTRVGRTMSHARNNAPPAAFRRATPKSTRPLVDTGFAPRPLRACAPLGSTSSSRGRRSRAPPWTTGMRRGTPPICARRTRSTSPPKLPHRTLASCTTRCPRPSRQR